MRIRINPGTLIAVAALVLALAGSAIALPGKNIVDKNDIKKGAVKTKAIKKGAVTGPKLAGNAVSSEKIADGSVTEADLSAEVTGKLAPLAFGLVEADGTMLHGKNASVTAFGGGGGGVYCITPGGGIAPEAAVLSVLPAGASSRIGFTIVQVPLAFWNLEAPHCPDGALEVNMLRFDGDEIDNADGMGNIEGDALNPSDEAFSFVIYG